MGLPCSVYTGSSSKKYKQEGWRGFCTSTARWMECVALLALLVSSCSSDVRPLPCVPPPRLWDRPFFCLELRMTPGEIYDARQLGRQDRKAGPKAGPFPSQLVTTPADRQVVPKTHCEMRFYGRGTATRQRHHRAPGGRTDDDTGEPFFRGKRRRKTKRPPVCSLQMANRQGGEEYRSSARCCCVRPVRASRASTSSRPHG